MKDATPDRLTIRLEGSFYAQHSLAHVNRRLFAALGRTGCVDVSLVPIDVAPGELPPGRLRDAIAEACFRPLSAPAVAQFRHHFPPGFHSPPEGSLVLNQPWEYGTLPVDWVPPIISGVAEIWCYSTFVREVYVRSGIPEERVQVVPLGVDADIFRPDALPYILTTEPGAERLRGRRPACTFIYVGGTIERKGADILLDSYLKAFSALDDVCLIVKDTGVRTVYQGQNLRDRLLELARDPTRPPIVYIDSELNERRLAGLIASAGCFVMPYRGEGFCLPALEAMACGLPVVVTGGGATDDFVDDEVGWRLPSERVRLPDKRVGPWECVGEPWLLEVDRDCLARTLREVAQNAAERKRRGKAARARAADWSWGRTAAAAVARLEALAMASVDHVAWETRDTDSVGLETRPADSPALKPAATTGPRETNAGTPGTHKAAAPKPEASSRPAKKPPGALRRAAPPAAATTHRPTCPEGARLHRPAFSTPANGARANDGRANGARANETRARGAPGNESRATGTPPSATPPNRGPAPGIIALENGSPQSQSHPPLTVPAAPRKVVAALCMIVKNEERVLGTCLKSVKPWFERIYITDTGSTDRTVEIAKAAGAIVSRFDWCQDFAAARNASMAPALSDPGIDWLAWLDADDELPPESGLKIRQAMESAPPFIGGYVIPVQFVDADGRPNGTRVDHLKLLRNRPGLRWTGRIHEQILLSVRACCGEYTRLDAIVLHSGYDTTPEGQARKRERDAELLQKMYEDDPNSPYTLFCLGMTDHHNGLHATAVEWMRRSIQNSSPQDSTVRKAYSLMAESLRALGRGNEAQQTMEEGLAVTPGDPELLFNLGRLHMDRGEYAAARRHYHAVLKADIRNHLSSIDMGILGYKTYFNLAKVELALGDYPAARELLLRSLAEQPQEVSAAAELFEHAVTAGDLQTAKRAADAMARAASHTQEAVAMRARLAELNAAGPEAEVKLRAAASQDAGATLALARKLLNEGRDKEAEAPLRALEAAGVAEAAFFLGVQAVRQGDMLAGLRWTERALELNPGHVQTLQQVESLKQAIGAGP